MHAPPNANYAACEALLAELVRGGVSHVCICPGSRSTPLAATAHRLPELHCSSHVDERVAGFYALGVAKATRAPVALVCTSGTAAANFHPAVVEAHHAGVPLVVLTADRPPELRDWGAAQTIDQLHLYARSVRWFADAPLPEPDPAILRQFRALGARAAALATGAHPGPVHLNLPFREPLAPEASGADPGDAAQAAERAERPFTRVAPVQRGPGEAEAQALATRLRAAQRGWIVAGPLDGGDGEADAIRSLARRLGWPLLAEATSQLRHGSGAGDVAVVTHFDALLRDERFTEAHAPRCVLRFGATPTSKAFRLWLERVAAEDVLHVEPAEAWRDASHVASDLLPYAPLALCEALLPHLPEPEDRSWEDAHRRAQARAEAAIAARLGEEEHLCGPSVVRDLAGALPADALLYVANSLAVRDLDAFLPCSEVPLRVLCNRGANGIDGTLASAIGAAAALPDRSHVLLTGDVAFLHDASALLSAARNEVHLTIVVLDDDGGAIFSALPVAAHGDAVGFERHFRTRHGADLGAIARAYGARSVDLTSRDHLRTELKNLASGSGVTLLRVPIDPDAARALRAELVDGAIQAACSE